MLADIGLGNIVLRGADQVGGLLPSLLGALVIFVIGWISARTVGRVVHAAVTTSDVDSPADRPVLGAPLEQSDEHPTEVEAARTCRAVKAEPVIDLRTPAAITSRSRNRSAGLSSNAEPTPGRHWPDTLPAAARGHSPFGGIDALPDPVIILDHPSLTVSHANPAAERLFGWTLSDKIGTSAVDLVHHDDLALALASLGTVTEKDAGAPIDLRINTAAGWIVAELTGAHHTRPSGDVLLLALRDLTERRRWEVGHNDNAAFRTIVHNAGALLVHITSGGVVTSASAAVTRDLGHDPEILYNHPFAEIVHREDRQTLTEAFAMLRHGEAPTRVTIEARLNSRYDRAVPYQLQITRLDAEPTLDGYVISGHDITQLDQARQRLSHTAAHDHLTGILNRSGFINRLTADLETNPTLSVGFVDLNDFKAINDTHGHAAGDHVLTVIANRITSTIRHSDYAGRIGGDEFAIALHANDPGIVAAITRRLTDAIAEQVTLDHTTIHVGATIGHTTATPGTSVDQLLADADAHMYRLKPARSSDPGGGPG